MKVSEIKANKDLFLKKIIKDIAMLLLSDWFGNSKRRTQKTQENFIKKILKDRKVPSDMIDDLVHDIWWELYNTFIDDTPYEKSMEDWNNEIDKTITFWDEF